MSRTVSVIIPTHNRAHLIARAIASATAQDYPIHEIIVVDDCSTDDTVSIVRALPGPITYLRMDRNGGSQLARNAGVAAATGDYLAFLDSDDFWHPHKIRLQMACAAGADVAVTCGYRHGDAATGEFLMPTPQIRPEQVMVYNFIGPTSNLLVTRTALEKAGGFDPAMPACQDWELCIRLLQVGPMRAATEILTYQDVDDPMRITRNRARVIAGHKRIYALIRETPAFRAMPLWKRLMVRGLQMRKLRIIASGAHPRSAASISPLAALPSPSN
jgi:glycosyltransferase involved in cell wall biosynthesis